MEPIELTPEEIIFKCNHVWKTSDGKTNITFEAMCKTGDSSQKIMDLTKHGISGFMLRKIWKDKDFYANSVRAAYSNVNLNEQSKSMIENINDATKRAFIKFINDHSSAEVEANLKKDLPVGDAFFKYLTSDDYKAIVEFTKVCKKNNKSLDDLIKGNDWVGENPAYINYKFYFGKNTIVADRERKAILIQNLIDKKVFGTMKIFLPSFTISFKGDELPKSIDASYVVSTLTVLTQ